MSLPPGDPRRSRAWRTLSALVRREEPVCWLRLPGCTYHSTTADHVIPVIVDPSLALERSNVHGACGPCNSRRQQRMIEELEHLGHPHPPALDWFDEGEGGSDLDNPRGRRRGIL